MVEQRPERREMSASFPAKLRLHQSNLVRACGRTTESDGDTGPAITLRPACPSLDHVRFSELLLLPIVVLAQGVRVRWLASSDELGGTEVPGHNNPAEGFLRRNDSDEELI
jgi:hypothetical protein